MTSSDQAGPKPMQTTKVAEVINRALQTKAHRWSTHWRARSLSITTGISESKVHRWLQTFSVQPRRQKSYRSAEA